MLFRHWIVALLGIGLLIGPAQRAQACPFCSAVSLTFAQEIAQSQVAAIVRLVEPPPAGALSPRAEGPLPKGKFVVVEAIKGADLIAEAGHAGADGTPIETILLEEKPVGTLFLLMGIEPPKIVWSSPIPVSERAVQYIRKLSTLPEKGPDRLAFFQQHLEDPDETLARDAYDEDEHENGDDAGEEGHQNHLVHLVHDEVFLKHVRDVDRVAHDVGALAAFRKDGPDGARIMPSVSPAP